MKTLGAIIGLFLIIAIFIIIALLGYYFFDITRAVVSGAKQLEPKTFVPLAFTLATAIVGLSATLYTQFLIRRREIWAAHREKKIEIYFGYLDAIERLMTSVNKGLPGTPVNHDELALELVKIRTKAVLWASPNVLKAMKDITSPKRVGPESDASISINSVMIAMESLHRAMRKDLGLSNMGLENDFFIKIYLKDEEEYKKFKDSENKKIS